MDLPRVRNVNRIIFAGMGGSAVAGDIATDWLSPHVKERLEVVRDYHLPRHIDRRTLVLAISASGTTEETLNAFHEALSKKIPLAAISSGGLLEELSHTHQIPFVKVRKLAAPRSSLPFMFIAAARIAMELPEAHRRRADIANMISELRKLRTKVSPRTSASKNPSKQLAKDLHGSRIAIYASEALRSPARRFRASLNENVKTHALVEVIPECCHNDLEAWRTDHVQYLPVCLRWKTEPPEVRRRFEAFNGVLSTAGVTPREVWVPGLNTLGRIMSAIYQLDLTTLFLAELSGIDPLRTPNIDLLKLELQRTLRYPRWEKPNFATTGGDR